MRDNDCEVPGCDCPATGVIQAGGRTHACCDKCAGILEACASLVEDMIEDLVPRPVDNRE